MKGFKGFIYGAAGVMLCMIFIGFGVISGRAATSGTVTRYTTNNAVIDGQTFYNRKGQFYSYNFTTKKKVRLVKEKLSNYQAVDVYGGYVYFISGNQYNDYLYRVKSNGTGLRMLGKTGETVLSYTIYKGKLYYLAYKVSGGKLVYTCYGAALTGKSRKKLCTVTAKGTGSIQGTNNDSSGKYLTYFEGIDQAPFVRKFQINLTNGSVKEIKLGATSLWQANGDYRFQDDIEGYQIYNVKTKKYKNMGAIYSGYVYKGYFYYTKEVDEVTGDKVIYRKKLSTGKTAKWITMKKAMSIKYVTGDVIVTDCLEDTVRVTYYQNKKNGKQLVSEK